MSDETTFVCGYTLDFGDRIEGQELHRGDRETCERVADSVPAVAVSGADRPRTATMVVIAAEIWDRAWSEGS